MKVLRHRQNDSIKFIESSVNQDIYVWEQLVEPLPGEDFEPYTRYSEFELDDIEPTGADLEALLNEFIRPRRDQLLEQADKLQMQLLSQSADMTALNAYKQALRDFPEELDLSGIDYIDEIEWPQYS